jgi:hypothetical protein
MMHQLTRCHSGGAAQLVVAFGDLQVGGEGLVPVVKIAATDLARRTESLLVLQRLARPQLDRGLRFVRRNRQVGSPSSAVWPAVANAKPAAMAIRHNMTVPSFGRFTYSTLDWIRTWMPSKREFFITDVMMARLRLQPGSNAEASTMQWCCEIGCV